MAWAGLLLPRVEPSPLVGRNLCPGTCLYQWFFPNSQTASGLLGTFTSAAENRLPLHPALCVSPGVLCGFACVHATVTYKKGLNGMLGRVCSTCLLLLQETVLLFMV